MPALRRLAIALLLSAAAAACSSDGPSVSPAADSSAGSALVPTTFSAPPTTIRVTTTVATTVPATVAAATSTTTAPAPTTSIIGVATTSSLPSTTTTAAPVATPAPCPGATSLPADASGATTVTGNLDGDGIEDHVISYTGADGLAHVFLQRGAGGGSDAIVDLGGAPRVDISLEDFDHSLGAVAPPPLVVLALVDHGDGSATATFVSVDGTPSNCLQQWTLEGEPFAFPIDSRGPYAGLLCDRAAGQTFYVLRTATAADGTTPTSTTGPLASTTTVVGATSTSSATKPQLLVTTTARELDHDGIVAEVTDLGTESIPDDGSLAANYGDIVGCDHPPLFTAAPPAG